MRLRAENAEVVVVGALIMPMLALALGTVLHLGLYLMARQATVTAVQQGLTAATAVGSLETDAEQIVRDLIDRHSAAEIVTVTSSTSGSTVAVTATVHAPGLVPGLPRTITVLQSAVREEFVTAS